MDFCEVKGKDSHYYRENLSDGEAVSMFLVCWPILIFASVGNAKTTENVCYWHHFRVLNLHLP